MIRVNHFQNRQGMNDALVEELKMIIDAAVQENGFATLAVTGSEDSLPFLQKLSSAPLPWDKILITVVCDLLVSATSDRSYIGAIKKCFVETPAENVSVLPIYYETYDPTQVASMLFESIETLLPLDAVVLQMDEKGSIAGLQPGAIELQTAIKVKNKDIFSSITCLDGGEKMITMTLSTLLEAKYLALQLQGDSCRKVFEDAAETCRSSSSLDIPARALLKATHDMPVYWAP